LERLDIGYLEPGRVIISSMRKKKNSPLKKAHQLSKGLWEAFTGTLIGFGLAWIIDYFTQDGIIPWYIQTLFTLIGIIGSLITIYKFKSIGILYILGYIIGAWLLKDLLGTVDFILLIVVPLFIVLFRIWRQINRKLRV
jgi:hypothetical protein